MAVAFAAATRVADTREGLIAEVVTLLGGLAGVGLVLYGLFAGMPAARPDRIDRPARPEIPAVRPVSDLATGLAGLVLAALMLGGLGLSAGWLWAALGAVMLLPMLAGSAYLCVRFFRAPARDWRLDLRRPRAR